MHEIDSSIKWLKDDIIETIKYGRISLKEAKKVLKRLERAYDEVKWAIEDYLEEDE